jgi:hypothetical protein
MSDETLTVPVSDLGIMVQRGRHFHLSCDLLSQALPPPAAVGAFERLNPEVLGPLLTLAGQVLRSAAVAGIARRLAEIGMR